MGYYTHYSLKTLHPADETELAQDKHRLIVADLRLEIDDARMALDIDGGASEDSKWYDHEADLRTFSERHPFVLFELHGEGATNDDLWYKYFLNGKMQECAARIEYPPFDPSNLK